MLGMASSGPHSNGYSLIRKVVEVSGADLAETIAGADGEPTTLGDALLAPTRIYVKPVLEMLNGGGMVSLIMKEGGKAARQVAESTRFFTLAESLGGVESLIEVPAAMTHASTAGSPLEVDPGLVRLSVGLENVEDIIADLRQALAKI